MLAVRRFDELAPSLAVQAKITHQPSNSPNTVMMTQISKLDLNSGRSIAPFVLTMKILNQALQTFILDFPR